MEGGDGSRGPGNINEQVVSNASKLFRVLHDDTIQAKNRLRQMTEVLSGSNVDVNYPDQHDRRNTLLHVTVSYGFVDVVKLLLDYKADVNLKNADSETPLHMIFSYKKINRNKVYKPIVELLIRHKADVNIQNLAGDTLLHLAVRQETIQVIRLLVGNADARIPNAAGVTPLDLAKGKNNKLINDIFDTSFNNPDPLPQDGLYPCQDNTAGVADTTVAKDSNQVDQVSCALADLSTTYAASGAKHSIHGTVYQLCLLNVFALRALGLGYAFQLGTEVDEAEQFDDLVFKYQLSTSNTINNLFVQAKHKANAGIGLNLNDLLAKGNKAQFSLLKYFKSFIKITKEKEKVGQEASEIDFAICTNTRFNFVKQCKLTGDNMTLSLKEETTNVYQELFKEGQCYKVVTDDETVRLLVADFVKKLDDEIENKHEGLNTESKEVRDKFTKELSSLEDGIFKLYVETKIDAVENIPEGLKTETKEVMNKFTAEQSSLQDGISKLDVKTIMDTAENKPEGVNTERNDVRNNYTEEQKDLLLHLQDGVSLRRFLNKLMFVVQQQADNDLVKTVVRAHIKCNLLDTDLLTDAFYKQMFVWFSNKEGVWLTNETLENMIGSITRTVNTFASSGISRVHAENLLTSPLKFGISKLVQFNELMSQHRIVHATSSLESKLSLIQVAQAIEHSGSYVSFDSYMFMRVSSLLPCGNEELTINAFKSCGKNDLLVIDCVSKTEKVSERELTTLCDKLLHIITNDSRKKLVLIAPENHALAKMFSSCSGYYSHIVRHNWEDFTNETQDILLATQVYCQGQLVELKKVIGKRETELLQIVPLETLLGDEGLVIGTELPTFVGYNELFYIDRSVNSVNQIVITADIFEDISPTTFNEKLALTESEFQNLCKTYPEANVHLIEDTVDRFIWVKSQGDFKALRPYIDYTSCQSYSEEEFMNSVTFKGVIIISDLAGMGKSTVLTHFSNKIQAKSEGILVFRIDLNDHTILLENNKSNIFDHSSALEFLCNEIIMIKTPLEKALFKRKGKVVLMFDGFDEISPEFEEYVLGLIQKLTEATEAQIWITTRPFMKEKLEDKLSQWSHSLEPLSKQNQVDFLIKYWKHMKNIQGSDDSKIKEVASSLVSQLSASIRDNERELTGIPLQMKMLADCFADDFEKSPDLGKCFNLVDLYDKFIKKKFEVFHIDKNKTDVTKVGVRRNLNIIFDLYIKQHQWLALSVILSEEKSALLLPDYKNVTDLDESIPNINRIGIINVTNGKPHFIHRTFAEYCVAEYFMELLKRPKCMSSDVQSFVRSELLISNNYVVTRAFINGLLAKCQSAKDALSNFQEPLLTTDEMNNKYEEIKEIFLQTAIEGNDSMLIYLLSGVEGKDERVMMVLQDSTAETNETMLHLAAAKNNATFIKTLLMWTRDNTNRKEKILKRILLAGDKTMRTALEVASFKGHIAALQTILDWTRYNLDDSQELVKLMLKTCENKVTHTSLLLASSRGRSDVVQTLLQWTRDNLDGGQEVVQRMLETCSKVGWTALRVASAKGRSDVVRTLLQWTRDNLDGGQETVKQMLMVYSKSGYTSLHRASERGNTDVVQILLQWTHDNLDKGQEIVMQMLESTAAKDQNVLLIASGAGRRKVVQTLLQWTRDNLDGGEEKVKQMLETCNRKGWNCLLWASVKGRNDVVHTLLQWTHDNLHEGQQIVKRLLESRIQSGSTPLRNASRNGHSDVVQTLLQWARDNLDGGQQIAQRMLEACNSKRRNSLEGASAGGHSEVVKTLLQWTRDNLDAGQVTVKRMLEVCNSTGYTSLQKASSNGRSDTVQTLLQWTRDNLDAGQDVVKQMLEACCRKYGTSLHIASGRGHSVVVKTLLRWISENLDEGTVIVMRMLEACNEKGLTPLHMASAKSHSVAIKTLLQWTCDHLDEGQKIAKRMLEECDIKGRTSLHWASSGKQSAVVKTLLQWSCDNLDDGQKIVTRMLEECDKNGLTSLHRASAKGRSAVVETLLQWTCDNLDEGHDVVKRMLEASDSRGQNSLHMASAAGRSNVVQTLLQWTRDNLDGGHMMVKGMLIYIKADIGTDIPTCHGTLLDVVIREWHGGHGMVQMCCMILQWTCDNLEEGQVIVKQMLLLKNKNGNLILDDILRFKCGSDFPVLLQWIIDTVDNGEETVKAMLLSADRNGNTILGHLLRYGDYEMAHLHLQWTLEKMGEETLRELLLVRNCEGRTALDVAQGQLYRYDCEKMIEWALGNSTVNLKEHITALKNKTSRHASKR